MFKPCLEHKIIIQNIWWEDIQEVMLITFYKFMLMHLTRIYFIEKYERVQLFNTILRQFLLQSWSHPKELSQKAIKTKLQRKLMEINKCMKYFLYLSLYKIYGRNQYTINFLYTWPPLMLLSIYVLDRQIIWKGKTWLNN